MTVLVAYGTRNGSTAGIAEVVGDSLRAEGFSVEVCPARQVRDVAGYEAVVLGGAVYANRWHRDARSFVRRHVRALNERPVWLFSSGPLDDSADNRDIPPVPQVEQAVQRLHAKGHATFGGRLADDATGFVARAMARNGRAGDFRNPARIGAWARSVAAVLAHR
jgi:menaquinone-dependent protoporphyrinogen oxidase